MDTSMRIDDTRPIWIQLADNFRARITDGTWKPGQKIPSVRDLAIEAGTNPNTVQRALVATDDTALRTLRQEDARAAADAFIRACQALGVDREGAHGLVDERWDADL